MHCFKSTTNLFFLLSTRIEKKDTKDFSDILKNFYATVFCENVSLNPLFNKNEFVTQSSFKMKALNYFSKFLF